MRLGAMRTKSRCSTIRVPMKCPGWTSSPSRGGSWVRLRAGCLNERRFPVLLGGVLRDLLRGRSGDRPTLSVVVNFFNNQREAANTLYSLSRKYQSEVQDLAYEVIAIDHGSTKPLSADFVRSFGPEFQYKFIPTRAVSPVTAINAACRAAIGERLLVMIDGAHILTPGIFHLVD